MPNGARQQILLFSAPGDSSLRDELKTHLVPLCEEAGAEVWDTSQIEAGTSIPDEIKTRLSSGCAALLLVSASFNADPSCQAWVSLLFEHFGQGHLRIIPIWLRSCDSGSLWYAQLQGFPRDFTPIQSHRERDQAWAGVVRELRKVLFQRSFKAPVFPFVIHGTMPRFGDNAEGRPMMTRTHETERLCAMLEDGRKQFIAITAPSGFGKSTLLAQFFEHLRTKPGKGPSEVFFFDLKTATSGFSLVHMYELIQGAQSKRSDGDEESQEADSGLMVQELADELKDRGNIWVIIDNFECWLDPEGGFLSAVHREWLRLLAEKIPNLQWLVASLVRPRAMQTMPWQVLDIGGGVHIDDSLRMFHAFVEANMGLSIDSRSLEAWNTFWIELANRAHHAPLTLAMLPDLIKSYKNEPDPDAILHDPGFLRSFEAETAERGMRLAIRAQLGALSLDRRELLSTLALFFEPVSAEILSEVAGMEGTQLALKSLALSGLVVDSGGQYSVHAAVAECLHPRREGEGGRNAGAVHIKAAQAFERRSHWVSRRWRGLEDIKPQLLAWDHWMAAGKYTEATEILGRIQAHGLTKWGYFDESIRRRRELADRSPVGSYLYIRNLRACILPLTRSGRVDEAMDLVRELIPLAEALPDQTEHMFCWNAMGIALARQSRLREAANAYEKALEITRRHLTGPTPSERVAMRLINLASVYRSLSRLDEAQSLVQEAIGHFLSSEVWESTYVSGLISAIRVISDIYRSRGVDLEALRYIDIAAVLAEGDSNPRQIYMCLTGKGHIALRRGDIKLAIATFEAALQEARRARIVTGVHSCAADLGIAQYHGGQLMEARRTFHEAMSLDKTQGVYVVQVYAGLLELALNPAQPSGSLSVLRRGVGLCEQVIEKSPTLFRARYSKALGKLALSVAAPEVLARRNEAKNAYAEALQVCSAAGVVRSALMDLVLVERIAPHLPISGEIRSMLSAYWPKHSPPLSTGPAG